MDLKWVNIIVTSSNICGMIPLMISFQKGNMFEVVLIGVTILASVLMHLSETKHKLPGLYFQTYCNEFLWFDRIMAVLSSLYIFYNLVNFHASLLTSWFVTKVIIGLSFNFLSERVFTGPIIFMILHSGWHCLAFSIFADVITMENMHA